MMLLRRMLLDGWMGLVAGVVVSLALDLVDTAAVMDVVEDTMVSRFLALWTSF